MYKSYCYMSAGKARSVQAWSRRIYVRPGYWRTIVILIISQSRSIVFVFVYIVQSIFGKYRTLTRVLERKDFVGAALALALSTAAWEK